MKDIDLYKHIVNEIKKNQGMISFERFMDLALYTPSQGYYTNHQPKFGAEGDFVTAPLISPLFSQCLAQQCAEVLHNILNGNIVEFGAGTGKMAADILLELEKLETLPEKYLIVEVSSTLREKQKATLQAFAAHLIDRVEWLEPDFLEKSQVSNKVNFKGVILANELLDAMPVHRFILQSDGLKEICVTVNEENQLTLCYSPLNDKHNLFLQKNLNELENALVETYGFFPLESDYQSEINLHIRPWVNRISQLLTSGIILILDYGYPRAEYYHPQRSMGTLRCHMNHHAHDDPLFAPGLQDITAHVDFTMVAEAAIENNLEVLGFTNQAAFLLSCGLLKLSTLSLDEEDSEYLKKSVLQNSAIHQLTSPERMGELFKVMALGRNYDFPLLGFGLSDRRYSL